MTFTYSYNPQFDTKLKSNDELRKWVNTFVRRDGDLNDLINNISLGYGFGHDYEDVYYNTWNQSKTSALWKSSKIAVIDIDDGWSYSKLLKSKFINKYATLIYPSPSFTPICTDIKNCYYSRIRVVFLLENTNTDPSRHYDLQRELSKLFGQNPAKATALNIGFFGNKRLSLDTTFRNTFLKVYPLKFLPDSVVDRLIKNWRSRKGGGKKGSSGGTVNTITLSTKPPGPPLALPPTHGELVGPTARETYEVLFKDDIIAGRRVDAVPKNHKDDSIHCPLPHYHNNNDANPSAYIVNKGKNTYLGCYSEGIGRYLVPPTYDDLSDNVLKSVPSIDYRNEQYLDTTPNNPLILKPGINYIKSYMGSGKTQYLDRLVNYAKQNGKSVLVFSHLRSLAFSIATRFGLTPYLSSKYKASIKATDYYVASPYSFRKPLLGVMNKKWDYVIVDEISQLLIGVASGFSEREDQFTQIHLTLKDLAALIGNAEYSLLMDADLGMKTISFINDSLPNANQHLIWNKRKPTKRNIYFYYTILHLYSKILDSYYNNEKFIFVSNCKQELDNVYQNFTVFFPHFKILLISSTTIHNDECKRFIRNPNKYCVLYDAIFATPSMTCGVSIEPPNKDFAIVYGYFKNNIHTDNVLGTQSTTYLQNAQQLFRLRDVVPIHLFVEQSITKKATWKNPYQKHDLTPLIDNTNYHNILHNNTINNYFDFFNKNLARYYPAHRAYFKETLGFDTELIYPTKEECMVGGIFLFEVFNTLMFALHNKGYNKLKKKESKYGKTTIKQLKDICTLFKNVKFDISTLKFENSGGFVATKTTRRGFVNHCETHKADIETFLGPFPATYKNDPFPLVEELFKLIDMKVCKMQANHHYQKNKIIDTYKLC
ncbi:MAG: hypothetical protein H8E98_05695 [Bacteroidetes bacterium]|nr:hypothetical protein [Bacteroidota bacterium]